MPKSLKQTAEIDVFDYGKAVTLIISQTKEMNKTRNTLVDDINYLNSRKDQETQALERILAEKADVIRLKSEVTEKIIAMKSKFGDEVSKKKEEMAIREAALAAKESELMDSATKTQKELTDRQNELERRTEELIKHEKSVSSREMTVTQQAQQNTTDKTALLELQSQLKTFEQTLQGQQEQQARRTDELNIREAAIAAKKKDAAAKQAKLASLAAELENQASLVESGKSRNKADAETIRSTQRMIYEKKAELDNREIHLNDREATAATH